VTRGRVQVQSLFLRCWKFSQLGAKDSAKVSRHDSFAALVTASDKFRLAVSMDGLFTLLSLSTVMAIAYAPIGSS
jgi:hypothetical protein